jgi:DNA-binding NtrC family response regulator
LEQVILIVDDEHDIRDVLRLLLEAEIPGIRIRLAASAEEALEVLAEEEVHLMLTDYRMHGMDGLELLRRVRKKWPRVRCILISAHSDAELGRAAVEDLGAVDFIQKPFHLDGWVVAVKKALERA